jgi:hypothetical protein
MIQTDTAQKMIEATGLFLDSLTPEQRAKALFRVDSNERMNWDYRPHERAGLSLKEMDSSQQKLAYALLASGLSYHGNSKALRIMSLEKILRELEGPSSRFIRDPDLYYVTIFGTPSNELPWAWRIEGHHLSINFLIVHGKEIAVTPNFFGANPARVPHGPLSDLRILAMEEDLARHLLLSLDKGQSAQAIISTEAPVDIITENEIRVKMDGPAGLAVSQMNENQEKLLLKLVREYISRMPEDLADKRMNEIEKEGKRYIHFAWAGFKEQGKPHYYRLHGPSFFVEYDNTQNNANHIHTVWRDIKNDWGEDLLKRHYQKSHQK